MQIKTILKKIGVNVGYLTFITAVAYLIVTTTVYMFKNHSQTQVELLTNWWYAITCQWDKNFYERK